MKVKAYLQVLYISNTVYVKIIFAVLLCKNNIYLKTVPIAWNTIVIYNYVCSFIDVFPDRLALLLPESQHVRLELVPVSTLSTLYR